MKRNVFFLICILTTFFIFSENKIKIIDIKGNVTQRYRENDWEKVEEKSEVLEGTEFFTGFHSSISFEIGNGSYITINQLSNIVFDKFIENKEIIRINIFLLGGYAVVYSKSKNDNIYIYCEENIISFNKSGGEVYFKNNSGILINCDSGKIKITSKFKNSYFIGKNEICGIDVNGKIIENDYFLRRNSNTISNDRKNENDIISYFDLFFQPYSLEPQKNDYSDNLNP
ncbi:MAG TPA: hypothetical protein PLE45_06815 [Spirochaetota bacterium]|nr:hypothetical protein [Spirochaetota bacterium]HPP04453.1 hypothetical protein [Spirochaetota bacterium]